MFLGYAKRVVWWRRDQGKRKNCSGNWFGRDRSRVCLGKEKGLSGRRKRVVGGVLSGAGKSNVFLVAATMTKAQ